VVRPPNGFSWLHLATRAGVQRGANRAPRVSPPVKRLSEPFQEYIHMMILPPDVYVADTGTPKGRGVFASRDYKED
jgi:hypothetical protein